MKIIHMNIESQFRYFWLKTVEDVDLNQHCAGSLIGEYDSRIKPTGQYSDIMLEDKVYYMCGVAIPFNWNNNFHLAFKPCKGKKVYVHENGVELIISGAKRLPISDLYIDWSHKKAKFKTYHTCRNWQFAHYFHRVIQCGEQEISPFKPPMVQSVLDFNGGKNGSN